MSTNHRHIVIEDVGPIVKLVLPAPEEGGVVELKGRNGLGKTTALRAIDTALNNRGRIEHRDGAVAGKVEAYGITIKAMRNQTRTGELEVESLEGKFSVLDLVDPKLKGPGEADMKRIKALVQLAGAKPDPSLFYDIVGGQERLQELVSYKSLRETDLVVLASKIKRDLEEKARELQEEAEKANIESQSARNAIKEIDLNQLDDEKKLAEDHLLCLQELERLKAERNAEADAASKQDAARESLATVEETYKGLSVADATLAVTSRTNDVDASAKILAQAEEAVRVAREQHALKQLNQQHARAALTNAQEHESAMEQWRKDLGVTVPTSTATDEQIADATADVEAALQAIQTGALVRDAKKRAKQADAYLHQAADLTTQADALRDAAKGTDMVLSEVVQSLGCPLRVSHGRLVTKTDRSENELFAELSRGEQWKIALNIAIDAVGENGVLVIDQEGWEGIDPINREEIRVHLKGTGVVLYTASCDEGELRAA